jgi:nicotinamidase-related amidase
LKKFSVHNTLKENLMTSIYVNELPLPPHYDANKIAEIWKVPYAKRADEALDWSKIHNLQPASNDDFRISLIAIDVQNTFCIPGFELFVAGKSGNGAVEDNQRLVEFIYRNMNAITQITATLDTHTAMQIFHPIFLINEKGEHPNPYTLVSHEDVLSGSWKVNPQILSSLGIDEDYVQRHLIHYTSKLKERQKYDLAIWPYHAMLGSIGHALVSSVEEALFFHTVARNSQADVMTKGDNPLTEHYSAIGPEVLEGPEGEVISGRSEKFLTKLRDFDIVIIAGQAKSHCVASTIDDLLHDVHSFDESLVKKVYLLEDCTSPVVVPGADYSEQADLAFNKFAAAGMNVVRSTDPIQSWPGIA